MNCRLPIGYLQLSPSVEVRGPVARFGPGGGVKALRGRQRLKCILGTWEQRKPGPEVLPAHHIHPPLSGALEQWIEALPVAASRQLAFAVLHATYGTLPFPAPLTGAEVAGHAIVRQSVLLEHSGVEDHGIINETILGPNTSVAKGEVTASLVGPFVGFHHQSLLISAYWPEGKGNVAYGAKVGSNHTGRAPDQEVLSV